MSATASLSFNLIAGEVRKPQTGNPWSLEASQNLAKSIAEKLDLSRINIRVVQEKDNLGRIAEGLSRGMIRSTKEGGSGWEKVEVEYLGNSPHILKQKEENPSKSLVTAALIYPDQCVFLKDDTHIFVADSLEEIKILFFKVMK